jgi:hypothetical protein
MITERTITKFEIGGMDTAAVLFLLALEYGRAVEIFTLDGLFIGATMLMVTLMPYFVPSGLHLAFWGGWLARRCVVAIVGLWLGWALTRLAGPNVFGSLPLAMLIFATLLSGYIQFYSLLRMRSVK